MVGACAAGTSTSTNSDPASGPGCGRDGAGHEGLARIGIRDTRLSVGGRQGDESDRRAGHQEVGRRPTTGQPQPDHRALGRGKRGRGDRGRCHQRPVDQVVRRPLTHQRGSLIGGNRRHARVSAEGDRGEVARLDHLAAIDGGGHGHHGALGGDAGVDHVREQTAQADGDDTQGDPLGVATSRQPRRFGVRAASSAGSFAGRRGRMSRRPARGGLSMVMECPGVGASEFRPVRRRWSGRFRWPTRSRPRSARGRACARSRGW